MAWFDGLMKDVIYAVRVLRRTPGFSLTAIATLALVIGANTAVFSLANGLLLAPLPYRDAHQLHFLQTQVTTPRGVFTSTSQDGFAWDAIAATRWKDRAAVFSDVSTGVNAVFDGRAQFVTQQRVGAGFFRTLGVMPRLGREFEPAEDVPGGPPVAIISYGLWQSVFAGQHDAVGRTVLLRGEPWTIVGVMPDGFRSTVDADVWTPLLPSTQGEGGGTNYRIVIRLTEGSIEGLTAEMQAAVDPTYLRRELRDGATATTHVQNAKDTLTSEMREVVEMLGFATIAVLVIACVNLAALQLARGGSRQREIATRMALGGGRRVIVRQLLVESLVIAIVGGAAGVVVGWWGLQALQAMGGQRFDDWQRVSMDGRVLLVSMGLSVATGLLFGMFPALQASRTKLQASFQESASRSVAGGSRHWTRRGLVVAEVALGVVLLVATGLLTRTFVNLYRLDPGFAPQGLVTASISLLDARYPGPADVNQLFTRVLERLEQTPGIQSASVSLGVPYERLLNMGFRFVGAADAQTVSVTYVSPRFQETFGIPMVEGRQLSAGDRADSLPVVVVNAAFARMYSKDVPVVGRQIRLAGAERTVVGVMADVLQRPGFIIDGMVPGPIVGSPTVFLPVAQVPQGIVSTHLWFSPVFTVKASSFATAEQALRATVAGADPMLPIGTLQSMTDIRAESVHAERMLMTLIGTLAVVAVLLMAIGLHGVITHSVHERTREFGIRLALGSTPGAAMRLVVVNGLVLACVGVALGLLLAQPATTLVSSFLYGVGETDLATYVGAGLFLLLVAAAASLLPALRLLRIDPGTTLRST